MAQDQKRLGREEQKKLVIALRVALMKCQKECIYGASIWGKMLSLADIGLFPENLEKMRPLLKETIGYDPLEVDTRPKGEKQPGLARSEVQRDSSLQDLRRKIYVKAKAEPAWRFWGLYVHLTKKETLREAYRMAKA